jgi:(1->4)-alpha-D-glucan 1-alpha-D-glucosylmutase
LLVEGKATGVRIDHPDGLLDPAAYFARLQQAYVLRLCQRLLTAQAADQDASALATHYLETYASQPRRPEARPLYIVVEKILEGHEDLPETWPVDGTSGYDFLNQLNGVFVDSQNAQAFADLYGGFTGEQTPFADTLYAAKKGILETSLSSDLAQLGRQLVRLAETHWVWRDYTYKACTEALADIIACFPVYRTYVGLSEQQVGDRDRLVIEAAVAEAQRQHPTSRAELFDMLRDVLVLRYPEHSGEAERQMQRDFLMKFQQITGPVMAKGLEDTTFYRYTPLLSLNDVGGDPSHFGLSVEAFHQHNIDRLRQWPASLLATSTHDTKRSEDIRARLNVLSEMPEAWQACLTRWHAMNQGHRSCVDGRLVPGLQEEYFLYQTLLGAWPLEPLGGAAMDTFRQRIQAYMGKALREAKVHSTWTDPDTAYEAAVEQFVERLLDPAQSQAFLSDFQALQHLLAEYGMWNALSQSLLKITVPGVPDFYQGCDLWDLSLVDPDNRRPVDYAHRQALLEQLHQRVQEPGAERLALVRELVEHRRDGRIKLYTIWQGLTLRRAHPSIFLEGAYEPLEVIGSKREHLCAFARVHAAGTLLVLVPRLLTRLLPDGREVPVGAAVWQDTHVVLPEALGRARFEHRLTAQTFYPEPARKPYTLSVASVLEAVPVALLTHLAS